MLDHEKLDVYQCAIEHLAFDVVRLVGAVPESELAAAKQLLVRVRHAEQAVPVIVYVDEHVTRGRTHRR
jgi:flavin-binding protein dodecin